MIFLTLPVLHYTLTRLHFSPLANYMKEHLPISLSWGLYLLEGTLDHLQSIMSISPTYSLSYFSLPEEASPLPYVITWQLCLLVHTQLSSFLHIFSVFTHSLSPFLYTSHESPKNTVYQGRPVAAPHTRLALT